MKNTILWDAASEKNFSSKQFERNKRCLVRWINCPLSKCLWNMDA